MILDKIAAAARVRVQKRKQEILLEKIREEAVIQVQQEKAFPLLDFPFEKAIANASAMKGIAFICEVKKASPSKGVIAEDFPYLAIAKDYERAGADCISVLTEPEYFMGEDRFLQEINRIVSIPTIRKDFIVDSYQIYEAKLLGASCVLLIAALLDTDTLREYKDICDSLGLSALIEAHSAEEIERAIQAGARIVGVNNRDLRTFTVDISNSIRLRNQVPQEILFVADSGIRTAQDIQSLYQAGVNGVLIGETLMRSADKADIIKELRSGIG